MSPSAVIEDDFRFNVTQPTLFPLHACAHSSADSWAANRPVVLPIFAGASTEVHVRFTEAVQRR